jgi:hypothetical protein
MQATRRSSECLPIVVWIKQLKVFEHDSKSLRSMSGFAEVVHSELGFHGLTELNCQCDEEFCLEPEPGRLNMRCGSNLPNDCLSKTFKNPRVCQMIFPKAVTSRYSSNSEFARQHRRTLRLVALGHGIRTEEDYNGVDPTKKRSLNYEAMVRASAWYRGENGFRFRAHCA